MPPSQVRSLVDQSAPFVAEIGVGVVHHSQPAPVRAADATVRTLHERIKHEFDPTERLNPGVDVLADS